jgi:NAD-dependent dihydropyrimidine dehydrogenase PreA subunit
LRVSTIRVARDAGLFDPEKIEYAGVQSRLRGFSVPFAFPFRNSVVEFFARIVYRIWLRRRPVIDSALCARCHSCENVCPPRAIKGQRIDYTKCIRCYCCLEVCPNGAVRIKHKLV